MRSAQILIKMSRNVEIKAKVHNLDDIVNRAKSLNPIKSEIIQQHDTFYNVSHGRLKLRKFKDSTGELIYYDRPDSEGPKISNYKKSYITQESINDLPQVLEEALGVKQVVKKVRQLFLVGQTRIHIDNVEGLGHFMELEVMLGDDQSLEEGKQIADDLMAKLNVKKEDLLSGAYADMLK
ncbi:adenylate cyclase CyaB [Diabrotica undecimpunctata]|uniref:adenylate cyclase CyaB n=1 Tax=Diabrotica undecimpunctata TaxID=50387 RepID=UPI003B637F15